MITEVLTQGDCSLALSLQAYRTNASYERWDGARKMWGLVLNRSRDITRQVDGSSYPCAVEGVRPASAHGTVQALILDVRCKRYSCTLLLPGMALVCSKA